MFPSKYLLPLRPFATGSGYRLVIIGVLGCLAQLNTCPGTKYDVIRPFAGCYKPSYLFSGDSELPQTLKAEINAEAWESLHSDVSRAFPKPEGGRIAVKVINHLGDEVMKVFRVE